MTNGFRKLSGIYAIYGSCWLLVMVWLIVLNPVLGIRTIGDLDNPDIVLNMVAKSRFILLFPATDILLGCALFVLSIIQYSISGKTLIDELIKYAALFAALLFVYGAYSRIITFQMIANTASLDLQSKRLAFSAVNFMQYGNSFAVQFFLSTWLLLTHYLQLRQQQGNKWVHVICILGAVAGLCAVVYRPLSFLLIIANMLSALYASVYFKRKSYERENR